MHPDVKSTKSGRCPKCGMDLVRSDVILGSEADPESKKADSSYLPLIIIIGLIFTTALIFSVLDGFSIRNFISYFMTAFFITFAGFKLIDLKGFAQGYSTYDLLARKVFAYGYIYPFIELFFGIAMIVAYQSKLLLMAEFIVMAFSGFGVAIKLAKREKFQCVCLGTFLKVPLTYVTLVEDFGMAALAAILLII